MLLASLVTGLVVLGLGLSLASAAPATDRSRSRVEARRRRFVELNPTHVNTADILALMRREGVGQQQARFITEKAAQQGIKPFTMWLWLQQFDAEALGIVVAADLTHRQLLTHISNGTVPDLEELKVFAALNGLSIAGPTIPARKPARAEVSVKARKRPPMPPIFEPGTWPRHEMALAESPEQRDTGRGESQGKDGLAA